jgi:hypothetical protein
MAPKETDAAADSLRKTDVSTSDMKYSLISHLELLKREAGEQNNDEISTAPIFAQLTSPTQEQQHEHWKRFTQFGLLGGHVESLSTHADGHDVDPRIFYNVASPSSVFICGSQGSGKSHTLSCLLENCLIQTSAGPLPRPLTGIVFHFDSFTSDVGGSPCEPAFLSSDPGISVRVLCPPTNVRTIRVKPNTPEL